MCSVLTPAIKPSLRVFLAEDNQADVYLVELALREHGLRFTMTSALNGEDAVRLFEEFSNSADCPDIALLDQNLPRIGGAEIMQFIRSHAHCPDIPIVMMSSSEHSRDREVAKHFGATFFRKASDLGDFMALGALVEDLCQDSRKRNSSCPAN